MTGPAATVDIASVADSCTTIETCLPSAVDYGWAAGLGEQERNPYRSFAFRQVELAAYRLHDVVVDGSTMMVMKDGAVIEQTRYAINDAGVAGMRVDGGRLQDVAESRLVVLGSNNWSRNHFHWLTQTLPALDWSAGHHRGEPVVLGTGELPGPHHRAMAHLGHGPLPTIELRYGAQYRVRELEFSTLLGGHADAAMSKVALSTHRRLRARLDPPPRPRRRVYVARVDTRLRPMRNEADLILALKAAGFQIVVPGLLPFEEQVAIFASAEMVVAPHGAALANIVFCPPDAVVYELLPAHFINGFFLTLSARAGLRHWLDAFPYMPGGHPVVDPHEMDFFREWDVDVGAVLRRIEELDAAAGRSHGLRPRPTAAASAARPRILIGWDGGSSERQLLDDLSRKLSEAGFDCVAGTSDPAMTIAAARLLPVRSQPPSNEALASLLEEADPLRLEAALAAWVSLIEALGVSAVVARRAPLLLTAARGRVPSIQVEWEGTGNGPVWLQGLGDPTSLLARLNVILARWQRPAADNVAELFRADAEIAMAGIASAVSPRGPDASVADTAKRIFVLLDHAQNLEPAALLASLFGLRPLTISAPWLGDFASLLRKSGAEIADASLLHDLARAAVLVHAGGSVPTHCALAAGVPQVILPFSPAEQFEAEAAAAAGVAVILARPGVTSPVLQAAVAEALSARMRARAIAVAAQLAEGGGPPLAENVVAAVQRLVSA